MTRDRSAGPVSKAVLTAAAGVVLLVGLVAFWELVIDRHLAQALVLAFGFDAELAEAAAHGVCSLLLVGLFLGIGLALWRKRSRESSDARQALERAESRYRLAITAARCGVYEWDAATGLVVTCSRSREIFGFSPTDEPWVAQEWVDAIHPDDLDAYKAAFVRHLTGETPDFHLEYRICTTDGRELWVRDRGTARRGADGRVIQVNGVFEDITDYVDTRRESTGNARRLQKFAGLAADLLWETDASMTFTYAGGRMLEYAGKDESALLGVTNTQAMEVLGLKHLPGEEDAHRTAQENRSSYRDVLQSYRDAQGRKRLLAVSGEPKFEADGTFSGYIGIARDLTDWQEANEARRIHEARLDALIDNAPMHILFKDTEGRYTRVNRAAAAFAGHAVDDLVGKTSWAINPDDLANAHMQADRAVLEGGAALTIENRQQTPDGPRDLITRKFPLYDASAEIEGLGIFSFDVSELKEKDRSLQESEDRFRDFAHSASDWFWETDDQLRFTDLSDRFEEVTGVPRRAIIGLTLEEVAHHDGVDYAKGAWTRLKEILDRREAFREFEYRLRGPDGAPRIIEFSGVPATGHDGAFIGYRGGARDVTDRRSAEEAVRKSEEFLRLITDNLPTWIGYVDHEHRFQFVNAEYARDRHLTPSEMIGHGIWEASPPGHKEIVGPYIDRALAGERVEFEDEFEWFGGERRWFKGVFVPHVEDGKVRGIITMRHDVSALKQTEAEAQYRAERIQAIADGMPASIIYLDRDFRYAFLNKTAQEWYAASSEEIVGKSVPEILGDEAARLFRPYLTQVLGGEPVIVRHRLTYPDGVTRNIEARWVPDFADGEVRGFYGFVLDTSRQVELEENLRQSQKLEAVGHLTGGIAHDFNNLLLAIQANLDLIEGEVGGDKASGFIRSAQKGVDRAAELTQRLLAFSRRQQLKPEVVDLESVVPDFVRLLSRTLGANVDVNLGAIAGRSTVKADPGQLENALLNLAINARDAMPDGGRLSIDVDTVEVEATERAGVSDPKPGSYVRINIRDTGVGMSEAVCKRAFEPFFTTKDVGQGTGLGLSMVHGFIEQSGGFAEIASEVSKGTTVSLCLPRVGGEAAGEVAPRSRRCENGSGVVLLVEDDDLVREATAARLSRLGYEVVEAGSGVDAMSVVDERADIDLLFSDIVMPGGVSGVMLAEHVRKTRPDLPVLLTTGYPGEAYRPDISEMPFDLLQKPYDQSSLGSAIRKAVTRAGRDRARAATAA